MSDQHTVFNIRQRIIHTSLVIFEKVIRPKFNKICRSAYLQALIRTVD